MLKKLLFLSYTYHNFTQNKVLSKSVVQTTVKIEKKVEQNVLKLKKSNTKILKLQKSNTKDSTHRKTEYRVYLCEKKNTKNI